MNDARLRIALGFGEAGIIISLGCAFAAFYTFVAFAFFFQLVPPLIEPMTLAFNLGPSEEWLAGFLMSIVVIPEIFLDLPAGRLGQVWVQIYWISLNNLDGCWKFHTSVAVHAWCLFSHTFFTLFNESMNLQSFSHLTPSFEQSCS
jgi:hypothetical protein